MRFQPRCLALLTIAWAEGRNRIVNVEFWLMGDIFYKIRILILGFPLFMMCGCMEWDYGMVEDIDVADRGLFIVNEGNFQYGNASLSYYDPENGEVENEVFIRANGYKLGDVAQSMTLHSGLGWIVVNQSHVIFAIDPGNFKEKGRITGVASPRYIHFVSDEKAYVTQLWGNRIAIVDPRTCQVTGSIEITDMDKDTGSTEQMVQVGKYVYVTCWSYQDRVIKIDSETDRIVGSLTVGIQPRGIVVDGLERLWVLCDGGAYEDNPFGYEAPSLLRIDPDSFTVERQWRFRKGSNLSSLQITADGSMLYWLNDDLWRMQVDSDRLPVRPFIESRGTIYYGFTISPYDGDIYVADAVDYQQAGMIYRYDIDGNIKSEFSVGITPASFCWK